ncbi:hypothetical protein LG634_04735 [Streptomyces bambusae]|uniref:hypothetical protein n=1 Tax=Streptomyces bambusae TaxID=1550616 RepID=UPI001CFCEE19|nr:hypothetical protein [Streptomyces bambusae]MCB5164142.1 hypothetical protein [Streptomyces bambusae]
MIRNKSALRAAALGTVAMLSLVGCGEATSTSPAAAGQSADALGRTAVDAEVDAAVAEAGLKGLSPDADPAASAADRRLATCTTLWAGSPDAPVGTGKGAEPFAAVLRALEKRGWTVAERKQQGAVTETRLTDGTWTLMAKLTESDRVDNITLAAHHDSCAADVAARTDRGRL